MAINLKEIVKENAHLIAAQHVTRVGSSQVGASMVNAFGNRKSISPTSYTVKSIVDESTVITEVDDNGNEYQVAPFQIIPSYKTKELIIGQDLDPSARIHQIRLDDPHFYCGAAIIEYTKAFGLVYGINPKTKKKFTSLSFGGRIDEFDGKKVAVITMVQKNSTITTVNKLAEEAAE